MSVKMRPGANSKTHQAGACLRDARKQAVKDPVEAELALVEYMEEHRQGLREGIAQVMDQEALSIAILLIQYRHNRRN